MPTKRHHNKINNINPTQTLFCSLPMPIFENNTSKPSKIAQTSHDIQGFYQNNHYTMHCRDKCKKYGLTINLNI